MRPLARSYAQGLLLSAIVAAALTGRGWCDTPVPGQSIGSVAQATHRLTVRITGLRNDRGEVLIALFQGTRGFPDSDQDAAAHRSVRISSGEVTTVTFADLKPGEYAVALFHDENENGKLDTSLGFPLEGFGTSNNPSLHWRAPTFNESRFDVNRDHPDVVITIQVRYLTQDPSR